MTVVVCEACGENVDLSGVAPGDLALCPACSAVLEVPPQEKSSSYRESKRMKKADLAERWRRKKERDSDRPVTRIPGYLFWSLVINGGVLLFGIVVLLTGLGVGIDSGSRPQVVEPGGWSSVVQFLALGTLVLMGIAEIGVALRVVFSRWIAAGAAGLVIGLQIAVFSSATGIYRYLPLVVIPTMLFVFLSLLPDRVGRWLRTPPQKAKSDGPGEWLKEELRQTR